VPVPTSKVREEAPAAIAFLRLPSTNFPVAAPVTVVAAKAARGCHRVFGVGVGRAVVRVLLAGPWCGGSVHHRVGSVHVPVAGHEGIAASRNCHNNCV